jgi:hypothetical protein
MNGDTWAALGSLLLGTLLFALIVMLLRLAAT